MRWQLFFHSLQQDMKLFVFMCIFFSILRGAFIWLYRVDLGVNWSWADVGAALYYGFRISLKSAGVIAALSFFLCTLSAAISKRNTDRFRNWLAVSYLGILSLLFQIRLVYYKEFHSVFNQFMFNALYDDHDAILWTILQQYQVGTRLLAAVAMTIGMYWLWKRWLQAKTLAWPKSPLHWQVVRKLVIILFIPLFMIFNRFGGSFSYANSIHWENSAMSRLDLLNEAILDDVQALYRAYSTYYRLQEGAQLQLDQDNMQQYAALIAGRQGRFSGVEDALRKEASGARLKKPKHIYIILAESYAAWPLEEKYAALHLADGMKEIAARPGAVQVKNFLPNADGSIQAVTGLVTGLAEVNLHVNYKMSAYQKPFVTALAPQMKRLGYKSYFWYGGFSSWEKVKDFSLAQGFDGFYSAADLKAEAGNAWGVNDKEFFAEILQGSLGEEPSMHLIFTTSNHPPFTVNLKQEGLDEERLLAAMPPAQRQDAERVRQNGHFWYADKVMAKFIAAVQEKDPESLFIIMGDHSTRFLAEPNAALWERTAVPLFIVGKGIEKDWLPATAAGSHISVMPTLIELIAPKDFIYYSLASSLTKENGIGVSRDYWITSNGIGSNQSPAIADGQERQEWERAKATVDATQALSWWQVMKGEQTLPMN